MPRRLRLRGATPRCSLAPCPDRTRQRQSRARQSSGAGLGASECRSVVPSSRQSATRAGSPKVRLRSRREPLGPRPGWRTANTRCNQHAVDVSMCVIGPADCSTDDLDAALVEYVDAVRLGGRSHVTAAAPAAVSSIGCRAELPRAPCSDPRFWPTTSTHPVMTLRSPLPDR